MFALTLPVLIALAGLAVGIVRLGLALWRGAKLRAVEDWLLTSKARLEAERDRLRAKTEEIDAQPPLPPDELAGGLNDEWNKKP